MRVRTAVTALAGTAALAGTVAAADNGTWTLSDDPDARPERSTLKFGSSVVSLLELTCQPGSGFIEIATPVYKDSLRLTFRSGRTSASFTGALPVDEDEVPYASARVPANHPLFVAFSTSGRLTQVFEGGEGEEVAQAETDAERAAIEAFFRACEPK